MRFAAQQAVKTAAPGCDRRRPSLARGEVRPAPSSPPVARPPSPSGGRCSTAIQWADQMQLGWWRLSLFALAACSSRATAVPPAPHRPAEAPSQAASAAPRPPAETDVRVTKAQEDCESLLQAVLPFAMQTLTRYRELYPFGATMDASGAIAFNAGSPGDDHSDSRQLVELLRAGFQDGAASGKFRATALVFDISTVPPDATEKDRCHRSHARPPR